MKERILIIEDEEDLIKGLQLNLSDEGYVVEYALNGKTGLEKALASPPDLILLDLMMPEMDGLEVCRRLREQKCRVPILMLTAKGAEVDKVVGLEIGADDYITKPFSIRELLARIKAHIRRESRDGKPVPNVYAFPGGEIDFTRFVIRRGGEEKELTSLEADVMKYFIAHKGEVVTRNNLLDKVWGYEKFPTTRTVDNHILKLRKKIEEDPAHPQIILSLYGEGYRFTG